MTSVSDIGDRRVAKLTLHKRGIAAFSLTEMLVTLLIMTLVSTLLATGLPVAIDTYRKTVKCANAQVALSTTVTVLRGELGRATEVVIVPNDSAIYYCANEGYWACIRNPRPNEPSAAKPYHGLVKEYGAGSPEEGTWTPLHEDGIESAPIMAYPLVPDASITGSRSGEEKGEQLWVRYSKSDLNGSYVELRQLCVFEDNEYVNGLHEYSAIADTLLAGVGDTGIYRIWTPFV